MSSELKIRDYNKGDKATLVEIMKLNVPQFFAEVEVNDYEEYLDTETEIYLVAEMDGEVVGAGGLNFVDQNKTAMISWDFIKPEWQGKGVGSQLLKHRIDILKSKETIDLIVVRTSQFVYEFYEKNGFVLREIHRDYWAPGYDLYKMIYGNGRYRSWVENAQGDRENLISTKND